MTTDDVQQLVEAYFARAVDPDREAYLALFAPDVVIEDEGRERHGVDEVRAWRTEVPPVTYEVRHIDGDRSAVTATARVSGGFAGSPVDLHFSFRFDDEGKVAELRIRP
jgi:ketosteroid isomerase-like protein